MIPSRSHETSNSTAPALSEMKNISIGDDLVFQGNYDLLYYRKDADGNCYVFKVYNTHFYSSSTKMVTLMMVFMVPMRALRISGSGCLLVEHLR